MIPAVKKALVALGGAGCAALLVLQPSALALGERVVTGTCRLILAGAVEGTYPCVYDHELRPVEVVVELPLPAPGALARAR